MFDRIRSIDDLRSLARKRVPKPIFDFIDGGSYDEQTLKTNISDFSHLKFRQRIGVDINKRNLKTQILGQPVAFPCVIAPTGISGVVHGGLDGELLAARAARKSAIPYTLGMMSIIAMEELKRHVDSFWFQICTLRDRDLMAALIRRAQAVEAPVLVLTMTWPLPSDMRRLRRSRAGAMPPRANLHTILAYGASPKWSLRALAGGKPRFGNFEVHRPNAPLRSIMEQLEPKVSWDDVRRVRDMWSGKLLVKGVMDPDDATTILSIGADGVDVSNHGGNQLDGAPSTISMLPEIVSAVGGRMEVLLDGGVRSGQDVLRALALGAKGCLLGRAHLWGLAAGGEAGVAKAIELIRDELDFTLGMTGLTDVRAAGPQIVIRS